MKISNLVDEEESIYILCNRLANAQTTCQAEGYLLLLCGLCKGMNYLENEEITNVWIMSIFSTMVNS